MTEFWEGAAVGEADPSAALRDDNNGALRDDNNGALRDDNNGALWDDNKGESAAAGAMTASSLAMSRPMTLRSARWLARTVETMWMRKASARSMSPSRSMKATSGSIMQNSVRWRRSEQ